MTNESTTTANGRDGQSIPGADDPTRPLGSNPAQSPRSVLLLALVYGIWVLFLVMMAVLGWMG